MSQTFSILFMRNFTEANLSQCVYTTAYFRQVSNFMIATTKRLLLAVREKENCPWLMKYFMNKILD